MRLGCGSIESANNASVCSSSDNAWYNLRLSPDGNQIYYIGTDLRIWYYFNDKENSNVSSANWNKTSLTPKNNTSSNYANQTSTFALDKVSGYVYSPIFGTNCLREIRNTNADNPVLNCWLDNVSTSDSTIANEIKGSVFKQEPPDSNRAEDGKLSKKRDASVSLYPNPSDGLFTFNLSGANSNVKISIRIVDITGKEQYESREWNHDGKIYSHTWDASKQPQGYYIYHINVDGELHLSGKLVKL